jgi:formylglycine-generating enzyme required for sulfatase activity
MVFPFVNHRGRAQEGKRSAKDQWVVSGLTMKYSETMLENLPIENLCSCSFVDTKCKSLLRDRRIDQDLTIAIIEVMNRQNRFLMSMLLLLLIISACSPQKMDETTPPAQPISTASPTLILKKTETNPVATKTPKPSSTQNPTLSPVTDTTHLREIDSMPMIQIPAGEVWIGCDETNNAGFSCLADELPLHQAYLDPFLIDKFEVTNAQYALCVMGGACAEPYYQHSETRQNYYSDPDYADFPKVAVSWFEARDYCEWVGGRLPTEAEWVRAARGDDKRVYPWGNEVPDCEKANTLDENTGKLCVGDTAPVGSYPQGASPFGVMDLAGNVWEWTADWYHKNYYSISPEINPQGPEQGGMKVVHGGGFDYGWKLTRVAYTTDHDPREHKIGFGFRCVMDSTGN